MELLALRGQPDAIESVVQVVESPLLHVPDLVYAAAWRLAAREPADQAESAPSELLGEDELLDGLHEQQRQQARELALEVFDVCCRHGSPEATGNHGSDAQPR